MNTRKFMLGAAGSLAIMVIATAMQAQTTAPAQAAAMQSLHYCKADIARLCAGVAPGGGRLIQCLKAHENEVSIGCGKELKSLKSHMGK
jgi:hypothetical protein